MIKNVIFDMGNVLIEWEPVKFLQRLGVNNKDDIILIMNNTVHKKWWHEYDEGKHTLKQLEKKCLKGIPTRLHKVTRSFIYDWTSVANVIDGMPEYTHYLQDKGYKIYILSNAGKNQPYYFRKYPYKHFDGACISAYYKISKPNKKFYEILLKKYHLKKEECVFTDDMPANVQGAKDAGFKAYLFKNTEKLKKDLKL